uniref:ZP domain-containing protein n=1 Tax=Ditylenchus dipsaci TaxID=166011 RepID=A0A915E4D4_9BILA
MQMAIEQNKNLCFFLSVLSASKVQPKGIFISTSLIVAFHPEFLTKFDRVYKVQCYYMEMENVLEKEITVNACWRTRRTPVFYATIGQMVYHKWTCESSTQNQFCMVVHTCMVDDGNGDRVELIDDKGCAKDKYLLQNLDYVSDLLVGKEAHVYKYADRQSMFFDCQITLNIKEPGQQYCDVPQCPDPPRRRLDQSEAAEKKGEDSKQQIVQKESYIISSAEFEKESWLDAHFQISEIEICMSHMGTGAIAALNLLMLLFSGLLFRNAYKMFSLE